MQTNMASETGPCADYDPLHKKPFSASMLLLGWINPGFPKSSIKEESVNNVDSWKVLDSKVVLSLYEASHQSVRYIPSLRNTSYKASCSSFRHIPS